MPYKSELHQLLVITIYIDKQRRDLLRPPSLIGILEAKLAADCFAYEAPIICCSGRVDFIETDKGNLVIRSSLLKMLAVRFSHGVFLWVCLLIKVSSSLLLCSMHYYLMKLLLSCAISFPKVFYFLFWAFGLLGNDANILYCFQMIGF